MICEGCCFCVCLYGSVLGMAIACLVWLMDGVVLWQNCARLNGISRSRFVGIQRCYMPYLALFEDRRESDMIHLDEVSRPQKRLAWISY